MNLMNLLIVLETQMLFLKRVRLFNSPECAAKFAEELRKCSPSFAAFQNYLVRMIKNANTANLEKIIDEEEKSDYEI